MPRHSTREHVRFVLLNDLDGVLEPCGCTRTSAGGLDRIATLLKRLKQDGVPTFTIVAGDTFRPPPQNADPLAIAQDGLKNQALVASLGKLAVAAVMPSKRDVTHSLTSLRALSRASIPVLSTLSSAELEELRPAVVIDLNQGIRVGIVAGDEAGQVHALSEEPLSLTIAVTVPDANAQRGGGSASNLMVRTGSGDVKESAGVVGDRLEIVGGARGEVLWVLDAWLSKQTARRVQLVSALPPAPPTPELERVAFVSAHATRMTRDLPSDPEIRRLLDQVFSSLKEPALLPTSAEASATGEARFVGSDTCAACHTQAYDGWRNSKHGRAFLTLVERNRELDLECLSCHVTGYGEPGGASVANLTHLKGVGCESCHGPGAKHVNDPRPPFRPVRREVPAQVCEQCHDARHSDEFSYERARVELAGPAHRVTPLPATKASFEPRERESSPR